MTALLTELRRTALAGGGGAVVTVHVADRFRLRPWSVLIFGPDGHVMAVETFASEAAALQAHDVIARNGAGA
jgi:hypothetical protein